MMPRNVTLRYDSLTAYLHAAATMPCGVEANNCLLARQKERRLESGKWFGENLPRDLVGRAAIDIDYLRATYPHGRGLLEQIRNALPAVTLPQVKRALRYGAQGDEYNLHRAYRGQVLRAWSRRPRAAGAPRSFALAVNVGMRAQETAEVLATRTAALCAVTDALEDAGHRAEWYAVNLGEFCEPSGFRFALAVRCKAANEPLYAPDALMLPAVFRAMRLALAVAAAPRPIDPGIMQSENMSADEAAKLIGAPVDFWIDRGQCETVADARKRVGDFLASLGGATTYA